MPVTINGDGLIEVGGTSTTQGRVRLAEDTDNGSNYVELTAPASVTANRTVTFPDSSGTVLTTGAVVTAAQGGTGLSSPGASGNILTSDGTNWTSAAPASSFVGFRGQAFTSNGTFTIPTGITAVKITVVGGGGGGGGASSGCGAVLAGGGGSGGAAISFLTSLTPGNTLSVTIGGGGSAGTAGNTGGTGGNSTVASGTQSISTITGNGGSGGAGTTGNAVAGGAGGASSGGTINITGQGGAGSGNSGGMGGTSILGGGGRGVTSSSAGVAGGNYGGGGSGAASQSASGGAGGAGVVIFEW